MIVCGAGLRAGAGVLLPFAAAAAAVSVSLCISVPAYLLGLLSAFL